MSGFFALRRSSVQLDAVIQVGYKILLAFLVHRDLVVTEVPFRLGARHAGQSKASFREGLRFLRLLVQLRSGPGVRFAAVGASGVVPNLATVAILTALGQPYLVAALVGIQLAIVWNFIGAERIVFHDRRVGSLRRRFLHYGLASETDLLRLPLAAPLVAHGLDALAATVMNPVDYLWVLNVVWCGPLTAISIATLHWCTHAWHSPAAYDRTMHDYSAGGTTSTFSIVVPLRDEGYSVVKATVECLLAQDHPDVEVLASVGFDDPATLAVVGRLMAEHPGRITLVVSESSVHNKPTQLNAALEYCTGNIIGVFDAESLSAPGLLRQIDGAFQDSSVDAVQGAVVMVNHRSSWIALRSSLEYYVNHRSKMHFAGERGVMLMGGNTVFFRSSALKELGGWDAGNLTEDAEIGLRLIASGRRVRVVYDPALVSREEAPTTVRAWTRQRTRWNLGFMQTLSSGVWRQLPKAKDRRFAVWLLLQPRLMALSGITIPVGVLIVILGHVPIWATLPAFVPLLPALFIVAMETTMLRFYSVEVGVKVRVRDYVKLVVSTPFYQLLCGVAALRASFRYSRGQLSWEKTHHPGSHLPVVAAALEQKTA